MVRCQQIVFDGIWVGVSLETGITVLTWGHSRSSQYVKRNEQDETFVVIHTSRYRDQHCLVGDQLQRDVQHWLSPPDPSKNHDFVWKAHHTGTSAWFFESEALVEWKASASLWIHGKRRFSLLLAWVCTNGFLVVQPGQGKVHFCMDHRIASSNRSYHLSGPPSLRKLR